LKLAVRVEHEVDQGRKLLVRGAQDERRGYLWKRPELYGGIAIVKRFPSPDFSSFDKSFGRVGIFFGKRFEREYVGAFFEYLPPRQAARFDQLSREWE